VRADILAVGSELLTPGRIETNAVYLTRRLLEVGIPVTVRTTVEDDREVLASALAAALRRSEIVIVTGGLGPTEDDLTREAAAQALGRPLVRDPGIVEALVARFARAGRVMAPVNEKQADVIEGAVVLPNGHGTAPGLQVDVDGGRTLFLLPGPPSEMEPLFEAHVLPWLRTRAGRRVLRTLVLKIAGMSESDVEQQVAPIYKTFENPRTTILSHPGLVELYLVAQGEEGEARTALDTLAAPIRERLGDRIFSEDGRDLHEVVAGALLDRRLTIALAESCTGGLVAARLSAVPGASAFLDRAFVTYSNRSKTDELGVPAEMIERHGAVSEEVARAMAAGAQRAAGTDLGAAITGIAGPDGGTPEKPVGLVYLAIAGPGETVRRFQFSGDRDRVRYQASQAMLDLIRRSVGLMSSPPSA
jgi:nicotinamide-nucleotide amidase